MKFGVYDRAQKAWLTVHSTLGEAEKSLVGHDVSSAVVAPYKNAAAPLPPEDGEPKDPQEEVVVHPNSGAAKTIATPVKAKDSTVTVAA